MHYFLAKTDPETYSLSDLEQEKETVWDGVHSFAAIAVIKTWQVGDKVFIYHSQGEKKIVGLAEVVGKPYANPDDPRVSWVARVKFLRRYPDDQCVALSEIKANPVFSDFALVNQSRLSTMSVPSEFVDFMKKRGLV